MRKRQTQFDRESLRAAIQKWVEAGNSIKKLPPSGVAETVYYARPTSSTSREVESESDQDLLNEFLTKTKKRNAHH